MNNNLHPLFQRIVTPFMPNYDVLSIDERKVLAKLQKLNHNSIWGEAIKNVTAKPDVYKFRKLICELKSQASDERSTMENILGTELLNLIEKL